MVIMGIIAARLNDNWNYRERQGIMIISRTRSAEQPRRNAVPSGLFAVEIRPWLHRAVNLLGTKEKNGAQKSRSVRHRRDVRPRRGEALLDPLGSAPVPKPFTGRDGRSSKMNRDAGACAFSRPSLLLHRKVTDHERVADAKVLS